MEEQAEKATSTKCPTNLDYNAPFLSTRRPTTGLQLSRTSSQGPFCDKNSYRVPFSWEQIAGKPKDMEKDDTNDANVPPPKLPPGGRHLPKETIEANIKEDQHNDDDGYDNGDEDDDVFSDAIDIFSLCESTDFNGVGGVNSEIKESRGGAQSPSFIIQRFLPDAAALAATTSSALAISKNLNKQLPQSSNYSQESCVTGCGFDILFPWRMKHKPCGRKIQVKQPSMNVKSQHSARRKKKQ